MPVSIRGGVALSQYMGRIRPGLHVFVKLVPGNRQWFGDGLMRYKGTTGVPTCRAFAVVNYSVIPLSDKASVKGISPSGMV
jgi:hypothetical protein